MIGLLCMLPLAITSTAGWVRRLKFKRWKQLHRLVYVAAAAGAIHYWWLVKSDIRLPLLYAAILGSLGADDSIRALRPERRRDGSQRADPLRRARASGSRRWPAARRKVRMAEGLPKPAQRPEMQRQQTEREPAHADFLTNEYTKAPGRRNSFGNNSDIRRF